MRKLALALIAAVPLTAAAQDNPDESFFQQVAQAGHAEVEAGRIAENQATNPAVKEFAEMVVTDHAAINDRLGKLAESKGVPLPAGPSPEQKERNETMQKKSGDLFDIDYVRGQIEAHEDTVALLQKEIDEGKDADAKAFARQTLPNVTAHLEKIRLIEMNSGLKWVQEEANHARTR